MDQGEGAGGRVGEVGGGWLAGGGEAVARRIRDSSREKTRRAEPQQYIKGSFDVQTEAHDRGQVSQAAMAGTPSP